MPYQQRNAGVYCRRTRRTLGDRQGMTVREGIDIQKREAYARRKGLGPPQEH